MNLQRDPGPGQSSPALPSFQESFGQLAIRDSKKAGRTTQDQALTKIGDASAEKPVEPPKTIPCVTLVPPKPATQTGPLKDSEKGQLPPRATVSSLLVLFKTQSTDDEKQRQEDSSSKADRGSVVRPWSPPSLEKGLNFMIGSYHP